VRPANSKDDLLTNVMIYWLTGSVTSAARLYYESKKSGTFASPPIPGSFILLLLLPNACLFIFNALVLLLLLAHARADVS
jgi:hypothetical protein